MWNPELDESQTGIKDAGRNINNLIYAGASLVAQTVENVPVMWKTWVWSLVWEDSLEEGMATHSGILAWTISMDRGAWWATVLWSQKVGHDWGTTHRYADDTTLMAESEEELKSFLIKVKEESEKVGLKHNIQKTKMMASGPITSWEIDGETVSDFIFWGSRITADGDCSHESKSCLLLEEKLWPT